MALVRPPHPLAHALPWLRVGLTLFALVFSVRCTSSESHIGKTKSFLSECNAEAPCADPGQTCFCFCTVACEDTSACQGELDAQGLGVPPERIVCRAPSCEGPSDDGQPATVSGVCDVSCAADEDCSVISSDHRCIGGYCRREVASAGSAISCPSDMLPVAQGGAVTADLCVDRFEVQVSAYAACVDATSCSAPGPGNYFVTGREAYPVQALSFDDAATYCAFAGKRLPSRVEWQWVAQNGGSQSIYPWGDTAPTASDDPPRVCALATTPDSCSSGSLPAGDSGFGIADLAGNVGEWVDDGGNPCLAGGSYLAVDPAELAATACVLPTDLAPTDAGFRCVSNP